MHAVPTLYGCQISVTGMAAEERRRLALLIESHGGSFCPDLQSCCTHLLVPKDFTASGRSTPKILYARKWGVPLVRVAWLFECMERRICLDSLPFAVAADHGDSPSEALTAPRLSFPYSELSIEEVNQIKSVPPYLENAHIYVGDSLPPEKLLLLKRIILRAGGTRHSDLYDPTLITHYIIHGQTLSAKDQEQLRLFGDALPLIVHDQWLFACFYAKERLPPENYAISHDRVRHYSQSPSEAKSAAASTTPSHQPAGPTSWSLKAPSTAPLDSPNLIVQQQPPPFATPPVRHCDLLSPAVPAEPVPSAAAREATALPVLAGVSFCLLHGPGDSIKIAQLTELVEKNGGTIGSVAEADFYLAPLMIAERPAVIKPMFTEIWLDQVVQQGHLIEEPGPDELPYYAPLIVAPPILRDAFAAMKISITGFSGIQREFYSQLITALGATYTDNLSKRNSHLIAALPTGPKYEFATAVGIITASRGWLLDSARRGTPLDCSLYPVLTMASNSQSGEDGLNGQSEGGGHEIPLTLTTPGAAKRAAIPRTKEEEDEEMEKKSRLSVKKKAPTAILTPTAPNAASQTCSPASTLETQRCPKFLSGLTFAISQRLWHRRDELHDLVSGLGGAFVWSYDKTCTHYLHQGNMLEETFREFKLVRKQGKWIVSPWWLIRSQAAGRRLPEAQFPHTFNPSDEELLRPVSPTGAVVEEPSPSLSLPPPPSFSRGDSIPTIDFDSLLAADQERRIAKRPAISYDYGGGDAGARKNVEPLQCQSRERVFAISSVTPDQRSTFPTIIDDLGGSMLKSNVNWDPSTTHLVIGGLTKSEKFLAACASGAWILRPEYLVECSTAGRFLDEARFEWQPSWCDDPLARAPRFWRCEVRKGRRPFQNWQALLVSDQKRLASLRAILEAGAAKVWTLNDGPEGQRQSMVNEENEDGKQQPQQPPSLESIRFSHILISSNQIKSKICKTILDRHQGRIHNVELIAEHLINVGRPVK